MFADKNNINNSYSILGLSSNASVEEIKVLSKAYKKYHPDKLQDVSDDVIKMAKNKFQSVQEAYAKIKLNRGFLVF